MTTPEQEAHLRGPAEWAGAGDAAAQAEGARWAQQLVLFAPHACPLADHIPPLRRTITSRQPALRAAAAAALRVLAQRDPLALVEHGVMEDLFEALNHETDPRTAQEVSVVYMVRREEKGTPVGKPWSTGREVPRWAAGMTSLPRPTRCFWASVLNLGPPLPFPHSLVTLVVNAVPVYMLHEPWHTQQSYNSNAC
eukprot:447586-Prorocentrum_minimum.AAC.3